MVFNKPNVENLQNYLNNNSSSGGDIKWWSLPLGTSIIRVLPPWDQTGRVALEVYQHRIEYTEPGSRFTKYNWTCVERTFGRPCNICHGLKEMRDTGINTEDWEANSRQFYINALVMQDPGYGRSPDALNSGTHVLMRIPKTVYDWIVTQITNPTIGDITDPVSGIDIMITRSGAGLNTTYSCTMTPNGRQPIDPNILNALELYNLSDIFSSGFDDARVQGLVNSLKSSTMHMASAMGGIQQQMNTNPGYNPAQFNPVPANPVMPQYNPQPAVQQVPQYQNPAPYVAPQPAQTYQTPAPQFNVPASPFQVNAQPVQAQTPPASPTVGTPPVQSAPPVQASPAPAQSQTSSNHPTCFGKYNPADVSCITCPYEIPCTQNTK